MLSILIVDDDSHKIKAVKSTILEIADLKEEDIEVASDRTNAKRLLLEKQFDLMVLDLSLPERFGNDPEQDGGAKFLEEINIDPDIILPFHIIGLTAYSDLKQKYSERFSEQLWHLIIYENEYNNWQIQLTNYINYLVKSKAEIKDPSNVKYEYDLAIVTALYKVELEQVLKLDGNWKEYRVINDHTIYYKGYFINGSKKISVIAAAADQMGLTAASIICQKLIHNFRPKHLVMCGIAAGITGKGNFGDILIADLTWDYGSGKVSTDKGGQLIFKQDPRPLPLLPELSAYVHTEELKDEFCGKIQEKWNKGFGTSVSTKLKIVIGPIASGSYVIENINKVQEVIDQQRKLVGIDMETYAVFCSANYCTEPRPKAMSIKSVCDYGDTNKDDKYQVYAAFTSANFLYEFALKYF